MRAFRPTSDAGGVSSLCRIRATRPFPQMEGNQISHQIHSDTHALLTAGLGTIVRIACISRNRGNSGGRKTKRMKFAFTLAAAGLSLASAISDRNDIDIIVFKDVHTDPRWSNATEVSPSLKPVSLHASPPTCILQDNWEPLNASAALSYWLWGRPWMSSYRDPPPPPPPPPPNPPPPPGPDRLPATLSSEPTTSPCNYRCSRRARADDHFRAFRPKFSSATGATRTRQSTAVTPGRTRPTPLTSGAASAGPP